MDKITDKKTTTVTIGKTTYIVNCYGSFTEQQIKEKIARLIKNEAAKNK